MAEHQKDNDQDKIIGRLEKVEWAMLRLEQSVGQLQNLIVRRFPVVSKLYYGIQRIYFEFKIVQKCVLLKRL